MVAAAVHEGNRALLVKGVEHKFAPDPFGSGKPTPNVLDDRWSRSVMRVRTEKPYEIDLAMCIRFRIGPFHVCAGSIM